MLSFNKRDEHGLRSLEFKLNYEENSAERPNFRGYLKGFHDNGQMLFEVIADPNADHMTITFMHDNEQIGAQQIVYYETNKNDDLIPNMTTWYPNGQKHSEFVKVGENATLSMLREDGSLLSQLAIIDDGMDFKVWGEKGFLLLDAIYLRKELGESGNFQIDGKIVIFYPNGQRYLEGEFLASNDNIGNFLLKNQNMVALPPDDIAAFFLNNGWIKMTGAWDELGNSLDLP